MDVWMAVRSNFKQFHYTIVGYKLINRKTTGRRSQMKDFSYCRRHVLPIYIFEDCLVTVTQPWPNSAQIYDGITTYINGLKYAKRLNVISAYIEICLQCLQLKVRSIYSGRYMYSRIFTYHFTIDSVLR